MKKTKTKKKKLGIHHRIHRHLKKHLTRLKKKRPHVHKALVLMSITMPLVLGALLFGSSALYMYESYFDNTDYSKEKITVNLPAAPDDTKTWKTYTDELTGFSVKYPDRWDEPELKKASGQKYLEYISFDNGLDPTNEQYKGFKIYVYDSKKSAGPADTDNLVAKSPGTFQVNNCSKAEFQEAIVGEGDYPAQEVDIPNNDRCFQPAYFFSFSRSGYIFNIVPEVGPQDSPIKSGIKSDVISGFPKFFELISTITVPEEEAPPVMERTPVRRQAVKVPPPHRTLIHLASCPIKNHHGKKSKTKGHHMDEDCCMDPDESPNPRCQY